MATKSETDKYTAKAGIDFAKTAGADSIRDAHGLAMLRGKRNLEITTKENTLLCR